MMRIRIDSAVRVGHQTLNQGVIIDLPDDIAGQLVADGLASSVEEKPAGGQKKSASRKRD